MQTSCEGYGPKRAMGGDPNIVCLCHDSDLLGLRDTAGVGDIRLDDVDTAKLKVRSDIFSGEESLAQGNGNSGLVVKIFQLVGVSG